MESTASSARPCSIGRLILVPSLLTLAVTVLRLYGEVQGWNLKFFSREAGGGGALVGIVWLPIVFGVYFAWHLAGSGRGPAARGRAIGHAVVALVVMVGTSAAIVKSGLSLPTQLVLFNLFAVIAAVIAFRGWPALGRVALAYGFAARIPVIAVMWIAMNANWGTHFEKGPPGLAEMPLLQKWLVTGVVPLLFLWISFTIVAASLFGGVTSLFRRRTVATAGATA